MTMDQEMVSLLLRVSKWVRNGFRKFYGMIIRAMSITLFHTSWSRRSATQWVAKTKIFLFVSLGAHSPARASEVYTYRPHLSKFLFLDRLLLSCNYSQADMKRSPWLPQTKLANRAGLKAITVARRKSQWTATNTEKTITIINTL